MEGQNLNICLTKEENKSLLTEFLHTCISEVCGSPAPTYQQFSNIGWTKDEYNDTYRILSLLFRKPVVLYLDDVKMPQEFFHMPENIQRIILDCLKPRRDQLSRALAFNHSQKQIATMMDFDWRLKMVMGSSKVASLREPIVQLDLRIKEKDEENILDVEMNRKELNCFIKTLESANVPLN